MNTNDSDIQGQILALRQELGELSNSLLNLRRDDPRRVFSERMRSVTMEEVDRFFSSINETRRMNGSDKGHMVELEGLVERVTVLFQSSGRERASQALDNFEATLPEAGTTSEGSGYARFTF